MLPPADLITTRDEIEQLALRLGEAFEEVAPADLSAPAPLCRALIEVIDTAYRRSHPAEVEAAAETAPDATAPDLGELGDQGIDLIARLTEAAIELDLAEPAQTLTRLMLPFASCIARGGGELSHLLPVVNAAATLANGLREPAELLQLSAMLDDIAAAVSPRLTHAAPGSEGHGAWRVLLINRAIVATRSLRPAAMETAFEALAEHLPEDAPAFFREGMAQMDALDYPPQVRAVMHAYAGRFREQRRLH